MALIVEDGTGLATAESYISAADATTYFSSHEASSAWTAASSDAKDAALRIAAKWLDNRYDWDSYVLRETQALLWPRYSFSSPDGRYFATGVPQLVKDAQCEAARAHLATSLNEVRDRGGAINSVAAGSVEVVYLPGAPAGRTFPYIDSLVAPLLRYGGGRRLVRG